MELIEWSLVNMDVDNSSHLILQLLMQLPCHIYWEDLNGNALGCNQSVATYLGFGSPDEMIGKSREEIYPKSNIEQLDRLHKQVVSEDQSITTIEEVHLPNGKTIAFQSYKAPLKNEAGEIIGLIGISFDISKVGYENKALKNVIEMMPGNIWWKGVDGRLLGCNLEMAHSMGFSSVEEALGLDSHSLMSKSLPKDVQKNTINKISLNDNLVLNENKIFKGEEVVFNNGKSTVYLSTKKPLKDSKGNVIGLLGIAQNITDKRNELESLKNILTLLPGHIWWRDKSGAFLGCNQLMAKHMGFDSAKDLIGKKSIDLVSDKVSLEDKKRIVEDVERIDKRIISDGEIFEGEEVGEIDGERRVFYSQKLPLRDLDGKITGTIGIAQDITELKETQKKLEAANEVKAEFIANMSHDLRTPITGMLGETEFIEERAKDPEVRECGKYLKQATQQLLRLSNDVLEYVSLESGYFDEPIGVFNPIEVIENVMTLMRVSLRNKKLDFKTDIAPDVPKVVKGYGQYFERIVSNLVANAIKFTEAGFVSVSLLVTSQASDEISLQLIVEDTGVGIPANKYDEIFDQFAKLSSSYQGVYKGSGLGLYSVKQYIGQMQGHIKVDSVVGKGTKFIVDLPFDKAQSAQTIELNFDRVVAPAIIKPDQASCEITLLDTSINRKAKILVVEDSPLPARAVIRLLNDYNCEVKLIESGEDAVKAALKKRYDLILMDIGLPGIDGIETTRRIRALPENNDVPVVALTGHARASHQTACIEAGMQEVYSKPLSRHQLKSLFNNFIDNKNEAESTDLQVEVEKYILDIDAMLDQFAVSNPSQLLDMLEATLDFIPKETKQLGDAVQAINLEKIRIIVQDLKGGLAYIVAPECNDLIVRWDSILQHEDLKKDTLDRMLEQIKRSLDDLNDSIEKVVGVLKK